jgi:hypothetical protein
VRLGVRRGDVAEEDRLDNAAATPHTGDASVVEVPVEVLGGLAHEHEALSVGDNLGRVERLLEVIDELLFVALEGLLRRASDDLARAGTLGLDGGEATGEDSLADEGDGDAGVERVDRGPLAGTLLASLVKNLLDKGDTVVILELEDVRGNVDQEGVEDALVPLEEDVRDLVLGDTKATLEDVVRLGDELHVTVLNT